MSLTATVLQAVRHKRNAQKLDQHENRYAEFGFLEAFKSDTQNLLSAQIIEAAKQSDTHLQTAVMTKKGNVTISNVRSCTIQDKENTSVLYNFVWATYSSDFSMLPMQYYNNEISYAEDFAQKLIEMDEGFATQYEAACFNAANAAKTLTAAYNAQTPYTVAGDVIPVTQAQKFDFYNKLRLILRLHNFRQQQINIVGSTLAEADVMRYNTPTSLKVVGVPGAAGSSVTDSNEGWQLMGYNWKFSQNIPAVAGTESRLFVSAPGSYAILNWNPKAFQVGAKTSDGTTFEESAPLPLSGLVHGHQYKTVCIDGEAVKEFHQFSTDLCVVTAYNSDPATKAGSVFEARILTT